MNTGVDIRLIVMGISLCFLIYSWLNHRKTMKKVKLKREEMDENTLDDYRVCNNA